MQVNNIGQSFSSVRLPHIKQNVPLIDLKQESLRLMQVSVGVGKTTMRSWWLTFTAANGQLVWSGLVDADPTVDVHGRAGLNVARVSVPEAVQAQLRHLPQFQCTWEPAWEQVDLAALPSGTT